MSNDNELAAGSIGIWESITMGVAGAAPAFSVAATTTTIVGAVGVLAPASILYCGIIMLGITLAFMHLNKISANSGASYAWVSAIFGPNLGFFAGWSLLVSTAVFMVSGSIPAATATLLIAAPHLVNSIGWVTLVAGMWLTIMAAIVLKGIKHASIVQFIMTVFEVLILLAINVGGIIYFFHHPAHHFSLSWFSLYQFTPTTFSVGALTALFLYWGWDVTLNLNEETKNATHSPGRGALWSMPIIILLFVTFALCALIVLSDSEIKQSGTNIIFIIAEKIFPKPWSYLAIIAVLLSTIGTLETNILQFTRTLFSKGRDNVLSSRYAKVHSTSKTPIRATILIWALGIIFLFLSSYIPTINHIIQISVNAIGFQVAFYYSLTGLACAWYFRKMWKGFFELFIYIIWPVFSSLFLIFIALYSVKTFDMVTNIIGLGGIAIGAVPLYLSHKRRAASKKVI
ncbi:MAG: APC family permease [Gammaproteobacteria bacterium]|nr:APC family permease [Gammaproteobacteria bacterium]